MQFSLFEIPSCLDIAMLYFHLCNVCLLLECPHLKNPAFSLPEPALGSGAVPIGRRSDAPHWSPKIVQRPPEEGEAEAVVVRIALGLSCRANIRAIWNKYCLFHCCCCLLRFAPIFHSLCYSVKIELPISQRGQIRGIRSRALVLCVWCGGGDGWVISIVSSFHALLDLTTLI